MRSRVANPVLAVLIEHAGYPSTAAFADAVNAHAWHEHGLKLTYDHTTVKRWLDGAACQNPDVVAQVLSTAWGVPIPPEVIWPHARSGTTAAPAHLLPAVADRTLEELAAYVGADMLTRRKILADAITVTAGASFVEPLARWLTAPTIGLTPADHGPRIGMTTVTTLEQATKFFASCDASSGGGLAREAAAGQLKFAIDLARDASYAPAVGNRLLAAIAELAGMVGWSSHDVGMNGPAQKYFTYGLHCAHASSDPRAPLIVAGLLMDLSRIMVATGSPDTAVKLVELALGQLPHGRFQASTAMLWMLKASALAPLGRPRHPEMRAAIGLSLDLFADADPTQELEINWVMTYTNIAELSGMAALALRDAAAADPDRAKRHAANAESYVLRALATRPAGFERSLFFDQIGLAQTRIDQGELEQAAADGHQALDMAETLITGSARALDRVKALAKSCQPWRDVPAVRDLADRIATVV